MSVMDTIVEGYQKTIDDLTKRLEEAERQLATARADAIRSIAKGLIDVRDNLVNKDYDEAWHSLYGIAAPTFTLREPWKELEQLSTKPAPQPQPTCGGIGMLYHPASHSGVIMPHEHRPCPGCPDCKPKPQCRTCWDSGWVGNRAGPDYTEPCPDCKPSDKTEGD